MGLERVAGPGHRAPRALWAKVFGLYLAGRGEPKASASLAGYLVEQLEGEVRADGVCTAEGCARGGPGRWLRHGVCKESWVHFWPCQASVCFSERTAWSWAQVLHG